VRVLLVNKFLYGRGGAEYSTLATGRLLERHGHEVIYWGMAHPENPPYMHADCFAPHVDYDAVRGPWEKLRAAGGVVWSRAARRGMERLLDRVRPDVAHLNNIAHQLSPSFLGVLKRRGVPMVMTLRDYKLVCPSYAMLGPDGPCDRCAGGRYRHCLWRRCTKGSYLRSLVNVVEMTVHHKWLGVYDQVDAFISPSRFLAGRMRAMGFERPIVWLPNFVDVEALEPCYESDGRTVVYFGRLSAEKGLDVLLDAVRGLDVTVWVVGAGPLEGALRRRIAAEGLDQVRLCGHLNGVDLWERVRRATTVVLPSICYENNPRCILEGFALGKPAIASRIGGIGELVEPGRTGWLFEPGDAEGLRSAIEGMLSHPEAAERMGRAARVLAERTYGPGVHYERLMAVYRSVGARMCGADEIARGGGIITGGGTVGGGSIGGSVGSGGVDVRGRAGV